jgi:hypothetical protein
VRRDLHGARWGRENISLVSFPHRIRTAWGKDNSGVVAIVPVAMSAASDAVGGRGHSRSARWAHWRPALKRAQQGKCLCGPGQNSARTGCWSGPCPLASFRYSNVFPNWFQSFKL